MIDIGNGVVMIVYADGSSAPFDVSELQSRLIDVCLDAGMTDASVACDIALSVEYALTKRFRESGALNISSDEIASIVTRILEDIGYHFIADEYRKSIHMGNITARIPIDELKSFIAGKLNLSGVSLVSIAGKVHNTLLSIGSEHPTPELVYELASHFREVQMRKTPLDIELPDFNLSAGSKLIDSKPIIEKLPCDIQEYITKRILKLYPINLRIFQYLRIDLRLSGLATEAGLIAPLTELSLASRFNRLAEIIDDICLVADFVCAEKGFGNATPLKLMLYFSDVSIFTREWMGCVTIPAMEKTSHELATYLCASLSRTPFKIICK